MKQGKNLKALAAELKRQHDNKRDFIVNTRNLQIQTNSKGESKLTFKACLFRCQRQRSPANRLKAQYSNPLLSKNAARITSNPRPDC